MISKIVLLILCIVWGGGASASELNEEIIQSLSLKVDRSFNGVILIAKSDKIIFNKAQGTYGLPNLDSQFIIGSVSKQITAAIVLELVDKNLINLEMPIQKYLPDLKDQWASEVTVKQLLNHSSGVIAAGKPLSFKPGSQFKYSPSQTYWLLSRIAEEVTGENFEDLLNNLFKKSGMLHSRLAVSRKTEKLYQQNPKLVHGYKEADGIITAVTFLDEGLDLDDGKWLHPGGGIISNTQDLLAWNLSLHTGSFLSRKTYEEMISPSSKREHPRYGAIDYGFGVQLLNKENIIEISHSGYIDGYASTLIYYPDQKISVIVLENISWDVSDVKRAFLVHDEIRELVRTHIKAESSVAKI